jgi:hypothetical protein
VVNSQVPLIVPVDSSYKQIFPHTCELSGKCRVWGHLVCIHHSCDDNTCGKDGRGCRGFICKDCTGFETHDDPNDLLLHAKMYEVADKYGIAGLKMLAREKFRRSCMLYWDHDLFPAAFEHALSSTPDEDQGLREILCETIMAHAALLEQTAIEKTMGRHTAFTYQVLKRHAAKLSA